MIVIVTGGRSYANAETVGKVLDDINLVTPIELLIEGGAEGADRLCRHWAVMRGVNYKTVHAQWSRHKKMAGIIRNEQMIRMKHDMVVAFPGGNGTADMVRRASMTGKTLMLVHGSEVVIK